MGTRPYDRQAQIQYFSDIVAADLQTLQVTFPPEVQLVVDVNWNIGAMICTWSAQHTRTTYVSILVSCLSFSNVRHVLLA